MVWITNSIWDMNICNSHHLNLVFIQLSLPSTGTCMDMHFILLKAEPTRACLITQYGGLDSIRALLEFSTTRRWRCKYCD
jgi:hypothetical protein